jgi:hypothetical protein
MIIRCVALPLLHLSFHVGRGLNLDPGIGGPP